MSVTWSNRYAPLTLAQGQLARVLQGIVTQLAPGKAVEVSVTRHDTAIEGLAESGSGQYAVLQNLCVLGRPPHKEVYCVWTDGAKSLLLSLTLANSGDKDVHVILSGRDGMVLRAFVERLEQRLGLRQLAGPERQPIGLEERVVSEARAGNTSTAELRVAGVDSEIRKVDREGIWKVVVAVIGGLFVLGAALLAYLKK